VTKSIKPHLDLIRRALSRIDEYRPADKETFLASPMVQDAIMMRLQEIGENLARIRQLDDAQFNETAPDSWRKLIGLRNVISHGYEGIEYELIWQILTEELPSFAATIDSVVEELP
jgi:uncharacterized protein with HEPN domain